MKPISAFKKIVGFFFFLDILFQTYPLCANDSPFSLDAKVGAFFLLNGNTRDLYGPVLPIFTLEGNARVYKGLTAWLDGSYLFGNGSYSYGWSHLNFIPISLGIKYAYPILRSLDFYGGAGPCYSFLITRDHSPFVHEKNLIEQLGIRR